MQPSAAVIGAGIGGLSAAILLAAHGWAVTVLDRAPGVGGKMREVLAGDAVLDAGPTVLTMLDVFEAMFDQAGERLSDHVGLRRADILARHAWTDGSQLDLHADATRSAEAIAAFAGAREADGFRAFSARAGQIWQTLEHSFVRDSRPGMASLARRAGLRPLAGISPFSTLWQALGEHFRDPRLRQLFGRYATYCGSSPFEAPATLMLVAHLESRGVWLVDGGMHRLAEAMAGLARRLGAVVRTSATVNEILVSGGRARGVSLQGGERIGAEAVVCSADTNALAEGRFGRLDGAVGPTPASARSLSALTWALRARTTGLRLARHSVLFSPDYPVEFDELSRGSLPSSPTVYLCAQDRDDAGLRLDGQASDAPERLLCLVNAPATGDRGLPGPEEVEQCEERVWRQMARCGLSVTAPDATGARMEPRTAPAWAAQATRTGPAEFEALFPSTGGALYGPSSHGWAASFRRPGARSRVPGLYLAGGSVHPGPGVPMAALSGRQAALAAMADRASTARWARTAILGGMSTPSARMERTD